MLFLLVVYTCDVYFEGGIEVGQKWDVIGRRRVELSRCSGAPIFNILIKENWISAMASLHTESNINILLTGNLPIDCGVRQWSHPLMILLHSLGAKSNNRKRGQFKCDVNFECDVTWSRRWKDFGNRLTGRGILKIRKFSWASYVYVYRPLHIFKFQ